MDDEVLHDDQKLDSDTKKQKTDEIMYSRIANKQITKIVPIMASHLIAIQSKQFEHKICGMNTNVAHALRTINPNVSSSSSFDAMIEKLENRIHTIYPKVTNIGISFGNLGNTFYSKNFDTTNNEIIICFILDTIDIDSKMATFVRKHSEQVPSGETSKIWSLLYKFDCSA